MYKSHNIRRSKEPQIAPYLYTQYLSTTGCRLCIKVSDALAHNSLLKSVNSKGAWRKTFDTIRQNINEFPDVTSS